MKGKIFNTLMLIILSVVCVYIIIKFEINSWPIGSSLAGIVIGITLPKTAESFVDLNDNTNWKTSQRKLLRGKLITNETLIRISFAYLYRIKINGQYFLIKNEDWFSNFRLDRFKKTRFAWLRKSRFYGLIGTLYAIDTSK